MQQEIPLKHTHYLSYAGSSPAPGSCPASRKLGSPSHNPRHQARSVSSGLDPQMTLCPYYTHTTFPHPSSANSTALHH